MPAIKCGRFTFEAELFDTPTTRILVNELPVAGSTNIWGEEIYFPLTFTAETESNAREELEEGDLAYWPPCKAFCIFFGPTPASTSSRPRAYSPVNAFGRIKRDLEDLKQGGQNENIELSLIGLAQKEAAKDAAS